MTALFTVTRDDPTRWVDDDSNHWGSEDDARRSNAEIAMVRILKPERSLTFIRNVAMRMPTADVKVLRDMVAAHIEKIRPQFMAIEGPVGWVKEGGLDVRHPINLPWGGTADSREDASHTMLEELVCWIAAETIPMSPWSKAALGEVVAWQGLPSERMSRLGALAMCNAWHLADRPDLAKREVSVYSYMRGIREIIGATDDRGRVRKGGEDRLLAALDAALAAFARPAPTNRS